MGSSMKKIRRSVHPTINLSALRGGVFPWNKELGTEFVERTKYYHEYEVLDLCAGTGHLGMTVAETIRARKVIFVEVDPASCSLIRSIWKTVERGKVRPFHVVQKDVRTLAPLPFQNGLVVANPPHAPLPDSFRGWRNVYGGKDGLLFVREILKWLLRCPSRVLFFVATYFLSQKKEMSIADLSEALGVESEIITNIYHFRKPAWNWIGIDGTKNPSCSENVLAWYQSYCDVNERKIFHDLLRNKPYTHHILVEGETPEPNSLNSLRDFSRCCFRC